MSMSGYVGRAVYLMIFTSAQCQQNINKRGTPYILSTLYVILKMNVHVHQSYR